MFTLGGKSESYVDVFQAQGRRVFEDFLPRHSAGEIFQNIVDRDTCADDTGFSAYRVA